MDKKQFTTPPAWINNVQEFQDAILHSTSINPDSTSYIDHTHKDSFIAGLKQFQFWHRHFQPSVTPKTLMFALIGNQGLQTLNIPDLIADMAKVGPIHHSIEFYQGPNTKFLAISFPHEADVSHFQQHFLYYQNAAVAYVYHSMSRSFQFSILWLPPLFSDELINTLIKKFADRYTFYKGSIRLHQGKYMQSSLVKGTCTLKRGLTPQTIPDLFRLPFPHNGSALLLLDGREPLCLKCMNRGHLRRQCTSSKCSSCRGFHPSSQQCPPKSYSAVTANKTASEPTDGWPEDLEFEHILDDLHPHSNSHSQVNQQAAHIPTSSHPTLSPIPQHTETSTPANPCKPLILSAPLVTPSFLPEYMTSRLPSSSSSSDDPTSPVMLSDSAPPPPLSPHISSPPSPHSSPSTPPSHSPPHTPPSSPLHPSILDKPISPTPKPPTKSQRRNKKPPPLSISRSPRPIAHFENLDPSAELFPPLSPPKDPDPSSSSIDLSFISIDPPSDLSHPSSNNSLPHKRKNISPSSSHDSSSDLLTYSTHTIKKKSLSLSPFLPSISHLYDHFLTLFYTPFPLPPFLFLSFISTLSFSLFLLSSILFLTFRPTSLLVIFFLSFSSFISSQHLPLYPSYFICIILYLSLMDTSSFHLLSFNARGLNHFQRRFMASRFIRLHNPSLVLIQEPRLHSNFSIPLLERSFPGFNIYHNFSPSSSGGVITLIPQNGDITFHHTSNISSSCIHTIASFHHSDSFSIYNIYGPTVSSLKKSFFHLLISHLKLDPLPKIILGDLNLLPLRDRHLWSSLLNLPDISLISPTSSSGSHQHHHTYFRRNYSSPLDRCFIPFPSHFFSRLQHLPLHFSDHHALRLTISSAPILPSHFHSRWHDYQRWQPPSYLYQLPSFSPLIQQILDRTCSHRLLLSPTAYWSLLKLLIKQDLLSLHLTTKASNRSQLQTLSLSLIQQLNLSHPAPNTIIHIKAKIHQLQAISTKHILSKLRTIHLTNHEKPTKIFFQHLHSRKIKNNISVILHPDDPSTSLHLEHQIISALHNHYLHHFSSRPSSSSSDISSLFNNPISPSDSHLYHISPSASNALSLPFSLSDISIIIASHPGSPSAGPDGLGVDFYLAADQIILPFFLLSISHTSTSSKLPISFPPFPSVLAIPIPKKNLNSSHLIPSINNFRIISTINYDLRILARLLNSRLGSVLSSSLHPHSYAIKGRNIQHSSLIQFTATHHPSHQSQHCPQLLKVDLSNAFDYTSHLHLFAHIIQLFGFSSFTLLLISLLSSRSILLKLYNSCSLPIPMFNGLLQGCPLSSSLYSIYMNPLLHSIDHIIHGLPLHQSHLTIKSLSFVDDLVVGCRDFQDAASASRLIRSFQHATGSPINFAKTFTFHLKTPSSRHDRSFSSRNSPHTLNQKILGHFLLPSQSLQRSSQLSSFLSYSSSFVSTHKFRHISLHGKILIINTMLISRISYHCLFLRFPSSWITSFYRIVRSFIWSSVPYISISKLFLPVKYGGLGLINLRLFLVLRRVSFYLSIPSSFAYSPSLASFLSNAYASFFRISPHLIHQLSLLYGSPIDPSSTLHYSSFLHSTLAHHSYSPLPPRYIITSKQLFLPPGQRNFMLYLFHKCLPLSTYLRDVRHFINISVSCLFCSSHPETFTHLFFNCPQIMHIVSSHLNNNRIPLSHYHRIITSTLWRSIPLKHAKLCINLAFSIWKKRCLLLFFPPPLATPSIFNIYNHFFTIDHLHLPSAIASNLW